MRLDAIHEEGYTWPHLRHECLDVVSKCITCQRFNLAKRGYHPLKTIHARMPGDHMAIDLAGPLTTTVKGNQYILIVVDVCTRFVYARAIPEKSSEIVALELYKLFCDIGFPNILQSDNGREFRNEMLKKLTTQAGVDHRFVTPYHPRANGVAERYVALTI